MQLQTPSYVSTRSLFMRPPVVVRPRFGTTAPSAMADIRKGWADPQCRQLLEKVIAKGMFKQAPLLAHDFIQEIGRQMQGPLDNDAIYLALNKFIQNRQSEFKQQYTQDESKRIYKRLTQLLTLVGTPPQSFVDIGCGSGTITQALAKAWGIPKDKALGMDVFDRVSPQQDFTQVPMGAYGGALPLPDNSQDLALMLMVLHHDQDPDKLLADTYRILKPGGRFIIREVDAQNPSEKLFHDVLDHLYYKVYNNYPGIPTPANHEGGPFWEQKFKKAGFQVLKVDSPEPNSPIRPIHFVLQKP